jgi:phosphohistidine phosphatase
MRRLILLRHAKSDWSTGLRDQDRPLSARGRDAAPRMGAYMARHELVPNLILASKAMRVRETVELLIPAFAQAPKIVYDERIYGSEAPELLDIIKKTPTVVHALMLVGHNPALAEFAGLLVASGDIAARQRLAEKFPTAGLAVIDFAFDDWRKIHQKSGRLDRFVAPRTLEAQPD